MATVAFTPRRKHEFTGSCPQVSCNKDGWIVMVYNSGSKMYSIVGLIERDNISWGNTRPQPITTGHYPKVAINDENCHENFGPPKNWSGGPKFLESWSPQTVIS